MGFFEALGQVLGDAIRSSDIRVLVLVLCTIILFSIGYGVYRILMWAVKRVFALVEKKAEAWEAHFFGRSAKMDEEREKQTEYLKDLLAKSDAQAKEFLIGFRYSLGQVSEKLEAQSNSIQGAVRDSQERHQSIIRLLNEQHQEHVRSWANGHRKSKRR